MKWYDALLVVPPGEEFDPECWPDFVVFTEEPPELTEAQWRRIMAR